MDQILSSFPETLVVQSRCLTKLGYNGMSSNLISQQFVHNFPCTGKTDHATPTVLNGDSIIALLCEYSKLHTSCASSFCRKNTIGQRSCNVDVAGDIVTGQWKLGLEHSYQRNWYVKYIYT